MTLQIGSLVVRGELFNRKNYGVHGWLQLRGQRRPLLFDLTGNPETDLRGQHIRFEAPNAQEADDDEAGEHPAVKAFDWRGLAWNQIGPTGTMTTGRAVRQGAADAEKPAAGASARWKRCLYLEWFSQNGRVVLELPDPRIEFVQDEEEDPEVDDDELIEETEFEEDDEPFLSSDNFHVEGEGGSPDDPYGLFPSDLQAQLDKQSSELDKTALGADTRPREVQELELMDNLLENGEREPVSALLDDPLKLPHPDKLNEETAEQALKCLLARLARCGVALSVCEHFTPLSAYRLLVEHICKEETAFRELKNTQWVQGFMTSDYCQKCGAELGVESGEDTSESETKD